MKAEDVLDRYLQVLESGDLYAGVRLLELLPAEEQDRLPALVLEARMKFVQSPSR